MLRRAKSSVTLSALASRFLSSMAHSKNTTCESNELDPINSAKTPQTVGITYKEIDNKRSKH